MKRCVTLLMLLVAFTLLATSCQHLESKIEHEQAPRIERLLQERYDAEFEVTTVSSKDNSNYITAQARVKDNPELLFAVTVDADADNMSESYVERKLCQEAAFEIEQKLEEDANFFIFCTMMGQQPLTVDTSTTLREYMDLDTYNVMRILMFIGDKVTLSDATNALEEFSTENGHIPAMVELYSVDTKKMEDIRKYFKDRDSLDADYDYLVAALSRIELDLSIQDFPAADQLNLLLRSRMRYTPKCVLLRNHCFLRGRLARPLTFAVQTI